MTRVRPTSCCFVAHHVERSPHDARGVQQQVRDAALHQSRRLLREVIQGGSGCGGPPQHILQMILGIASAAAGNSESKNSLWRT